jgi:predicted secreted protein
MNKFRWFALLTVSLILAGSTLAKFCPKCSRLAYIQAIGECPQCKGFTSSAAHKLCGKCSAKENKCQNCLVALDADTGKKPKKVLKGPSGKPYPAHWGAPPLRQTRDLRPLPDGYGRGSSTLGRWIQENIDKDAAGGKDSGKRLAVSRSFASKHPAGTYSEDELLVGMKKGLNKDACQKALSGAIPGIEIIKSMFGNTILHVKLPNSVNVEQAMSKLKAVKAVKYSEINGRVGIQPAPRPIQIQPRPQPIQIQPTPPAVQIQPAPRPELVAPPRPPDLVAPPVFRPGGGGPVDKAKVAQFKKSLNTWEKLKVECGGNYSYSKRWSSWVGFGHTTDVIIKNNKVVERRYKSFSGRPRPVAPGQPPAKPKGISWTETGKEIGSHKQGHPAKTLDELYKEAAGILERPVPPFQRLGLRFDKQGVLLACYTQDTRIADDAPTKGVNISTITLGKPGKQPARLGKPKITHPILRLSKSWNGKTIKVQQGQKIAISLAGNPTTGFTWNNATKSDVVKLSGKVTHRAANRLIGAPGVSTATFEAVAGGKGTVALEYRRVWEKNPPVETFKVNLLVTGDGSGKTTGKDSNQAEIKALEQEIAKMKDFAKRARFTPDGHKKFLAKLAGLEKQLAALKGGKGGVPTYEEWLVGGKKIPPGMMFTGGSPWFNERTGQQRQPQEVYKMIYGAKGGKVPPTPIKPKPVIGKKSFPQHWGAPPRLQTKDLRPLPGGYGMGSSTLAGWIRKNMERDKNRETAPD